MVYGAKDLQTTLTGERPWYEPPSRRTFVGGRNYVNIGRSFAGLFRELGRLRPDEAVLDIGCGIGRMAVPLLDYLEPSTRYEGFDVVPTGIDWCREEITARHPNFRFQLADVHNERYSPAERTDASAFRFPYDDESFDFAFATSVFTHMLPGEVANYLRESRRVLRPGGRLFATWYLLGGRRARAGGAGGDERAWFPVEGPGYRSVSRRVPEFVTAFRQDDVLNMYDEAGFARSAVTYGSWLGATGATWQDIVIGSVPHS